MDYGKGAAMIKDLPLAGIFVNDQEAALDFYTGKLGLEKVRDEPYGEGALGHGLARGDRDRDLPEEGRGASPTRIRGVGRAIGGGAVSFPAGIPGSAGRPGAFAGRMHEALTARRVPNGARSGTSWTRQETTTVRRI